MAYRCLTRGVPILCKHVVSLSTVVLNSRELGIGRKLYGFLGKFRAQLKINLAIGFIRKNLLECIDKAVMMLYLG